MNKEFKNTIREFLAYGVKCAVTNRDQLTKINKDSFSITNGIIFDVDKEYKKLHRKSLELIVNSKNFKKTHITEGEISSLLSKKVAHQYKTGEDQTDSVIEEIEKLKNSEILYIAPNHSVFLKNGLSRFKIGPVEIVHSNDLNNILGKSLCHLNVVVDDKKSGRILSEKNESFYMPEYSFIINVKCSPKRVHKLSEWYLDVSLSLIRLYCFKHKTVYGYFPHIGNLDPLPTRERERDDPGIMIFKESDSISTGFSNYPIYELDGNIAQIFADNGFDEICKKIFEAPEKSLAIRLQKALGWMSKARRTDELATRFLFFFTALEALLTEGKDSPVSDTIARNVATIIAAKESRYDVYKMTKSLYTIRCALVHSGARDVSEFECNQLQYYAELTCLFIMDKYIDFSVQKFQEKLKIAGFGVSLDDEETTSSQAQ